MSIMKREDGVIAYYAKDRAAWRAWLAAHHMIEQGVWLIIYKKKSGTPSVYYDEAVDEALCFGWVDSKPNKRDAESYFQYFSKRSPKSNWSRVNKEKIKRLEAKNLITEAGYDMIRIAKQSGSWNALDDVENLVIPPDLAEALASFPHAQQYFEAFPRSVKRGILEWIFTAKRAPTRAKRIAQTASMAAENKRANQYRS